MRDAPRLRRGVGEAAPSAPGRPAWSRTLVVATLASSLAIAGCDDLVKWVPIFSTMTEQPSVETYEEQPRKPVEGTIAVDGEYLYGVAEDGRLESTFTLQQSDTLTPPTTWQADLNRGQERFIQFCAPCHGPQGRGNGSVVGPNRIPPVPMLNLTSEQAAGYSDGYLFGMITVGRGLMPSYRRIEPLARWDLVAYVRALQSGVGGAPETPEPTGSGR